MDLVLQHSRQLFERLGAISICLQLIELFTIRSALGPLGVWAWAVQRDDMVQMHHFVRRIFDNLYSERVFVTLLITQSIASVYIFFSGASLFPAIIIFLDHC